MNCLACELARAKLRAAALSLVGMPPERIAEGLSESYGVRYYVLSGKLYRESQLPPYEPHLIKDAS
jgi:hypothetical protein